MENKIDNYNISNIYTEIFEAAKENALKYGKANTKAVLGKILARYPEFKGQIPEIMKKIEEIVEKINSLPIEQLKREEEVKVKENKSTQKEKKEQKKELPELPGAEYGKVITRLPPEPSKYNHIGHALSFLINYEYARKYNGKCLLKFEDTNPEKCTQEFVDAMIEDIVGYLGIKVDKIIFISDDMDFMYEQAEKLIEKGLSYVCFCNREEMQDLRHKGIECECRNFDIKKNREYWKNMLNRKYREEEATLRLKGDMQSLNHVMRDPVLFRITYHPHYKYKDKYCVWPLYDFENAVEDCKYGVTHILRSIEFGTMRAELQNFIKDALGFKRQIVKEYGRFNVVGAITQGREIRKMIEEGKVSGWDDPSLVTLKALKRRGIVKETIYELMYQTGVSPNTSKNIDWTLISAINRQVLDPIVNRYFFIDDPIEINIKNAPELELKLKLHPDFPERGVRYFKTKNKFYVSKSDFEKFNNGDLIRLMDCLNFKVDDCKEKTFYFVSIEYEDYKKKGKMIIHWLPYEDNLINLKVRMPDNSIKKGVGESSLKNLKVDDIVQFTRFGFCRVDEIKNNEIIFWFANK